MGYHLLDNRNPNGDNFYTSRRGELRIGVVHTAENLPYWRDAEDKGAENVADYATTTNRAVSWHTTVDSDSTVRMLPDDYTAFHVRGYNSISVGMEIATQAHKWNSAPDDWLEGVIRETAAEIARWKTELGIPIRRISKADVDNGKWGVVGHAALDPSRRSDPGEDFPWDQVLALAKAIASGSEPEEEDEGGAEPTPEPEPESPRTPGSGSGDLFEELPLVSRQHSATGLDAGRSQALLLAHEYEIPASIKSDRTPDRRFGPRTEAVVEEFQSNVNITVDGIVGPVTWGALLETDLSNDYISRGDNGLLARIVQALIAVNGKIPANTIAPNGIPDGVFGYHTERAVKKFQKSRGITVDGLFGPVTLRVALGLPAE